jgi:hypothetical protein
MAGLVLLLFASAVLNAIGWRLSVFDRRQALVRAAEAQVARINAQTEAVNARGDALQRSLAVLNAELRLRLCQQQRDEAQRQVKLFGDQFRDAAGWWFRPDGASLHISAPQQDASGVMPLESLPTDGRVQ